MLYIIKKKYSYNTIYYEYTLCIYYIMYNKYIYWIIVYILDSGYTKYVHYSPILFILGDGKLRQNLPFSKSRYDI